MEDYTMFPILVIAIGIAVLLLGKRLSVLGAAVGALLGVTLLALFPGQSNSWLELLIPILLAVLGFFGAAFAKGIVNIVLMVIGALAGGVITMGFLNLFNMGFSFLYAILVVVGGAIGFVLVMRFKDWSMVILAGLIGGLLITRGISIWFPIFEGVLGTLLVLVLMAVSILVQGGLVGGNKAAPPPAQ
jgi:hypothetical protein